MEERPTHRVYIEILMCHAIFHNLKEYRSHENEREAERARGQGARPGSAANQAESSGSCSTDLRD